VCLSRWDEYEESYQQFSTWLREAEVQLRAETEHKATVEEKKRHWDEYQVSASLLDNITLPEIPPLIQEERGVPPFFEILESPLQVDELNKNPAKCYVNVLC
jgi:hypothetical protein